MSAEFDLQKCLDCQYAEFYTTVFDDNGNTKITLSCGMYPQCVEDDEEVD